MTARATPSNTRPSSFRPGEPAWGATGDEEVFPCEEEGLAELGEEAGLLLALCAGLFEVLEEEGGFCGELRGESDMDCFGGEAFTGCVLVDDESLSWEEAGCSAWGDMDAYLGASTISVF